MKQQLEQLLKDAEEVTAKMREALAKMDKPAINMEHGKWYRVQTNFDKLIKFDKIEFKKIIVLDSFNIKSNYHFGAGYSCDVKDIKSYTPATTEDMQLLPDWHREKPKPALAATYEEVVDAVKPEWVIGYKSPDAWETSPDPYQLPTEQSANQHRAFIQIKNLEAYCAVMFEGERDYIIDIYSDGGLCPMECTYGIIKVTEQAAKWLIKTHPEPFLIFFGVK